MVLQGSNHSLLHSLSKCSRERHRLRSLFASISSIDLLRSHVFATHQSAEIELNCRCCCCCCCCCFTQPPQKDWWFSLQYKVMPRFQHMSHKKASVILSSFQQLHAQPCISWLQYRGTTLVMYTLHLFCSVSWCYNRTRAELFFHSLRERLYMNVSWFFAGLPFPRPPFRSSLRMTSAIGDGVGEIRSRNKVLAKFTALVRGAGDRSRFQVNGERRGRQRAKLLIIVSALTVE